jgi:hypothetical protein
MKRSTFFTALAAAALATLLLSGCVVKDDDGDPPRPYCGDGVCGSAETAGNCPSDCQASAQCSTDELARCLDLGTATS